MYKGRRILLNTSEGAGPQPGSPWQDRPGLNCIVCDQKGQGVQHAGEGDRANETGRPARNSRGGTWDLGFT